VVVGRGNARGSGCLEGRAATPGRRLQRSGPRLSPSPPPPDARLPPPPPPPARAARARPLPRHTLRKRYRTACRVLGRERLESLTIHHGRHTFISHALAGGPPLAEMRGAARVPPRVS